MNTNTRGQRMPIDYTRRSARQKPENRDGSVQPVQEDDSRMYGDLIRGALNHQFGETWRRFWPDIEKLAPGMEEPDVAASVVHEGAGVLVMYSNDRLRVATGVLAGLGLSADLVEAVGRANVTLPVGSVFWSKATETEWCLIWTMKLVVERWLDPQSDGTKAMLLDILNNAPDMTRLASEAIRPKFGGRPFGVEPGWEYVLLSHV